MKLLLWAAIVLLVIWVLRGKKRAAETDAAAPSSSPSRPMINEGEAMLGCSHCGIHFPASEAVCGPADTVFCSDEHRRRHAAR
jgi:uncharacterized protein